MKKVEVIIRPEKLDDMKEILDECSSYGQQYHGLR